MVLANDTKIVKLYVVMRNTTASKGAECPVEKWSKLFLVTT